MCKGAVVEAAEQENARSLGPACPITAPQASQKVCTPEVRPWAQRHAMAVTCTLCLMPWMPPMLWLVSDAIGAGRPCLRLAAGIAAS
jgi:hypothetical protein